MKERYLTVLDDAVIDLERGKDFYQQNETCIGDYFIESLLAEISSLTFTAGIHGKQFGFFRLLSKRFPFAIYYFIDKEEVFVIGVLDMRRNPKSIRIILQSRRS